MTASGPTARGRPSADTANSGSVPRRPPEASPVTRILPAWQTVLVLIGLAVLVLVIGARDLAQGGFSWSDAPLHAMDGVFVHDLFLRTTPDSLRTWAEQYYLKYPCLGFLVYYPPAFAVVEAMVFLLFGISVAVARATVLLFVIGAVWLIYLLARELFSTRVGLVAAILAITTPAGVVWSRHVMLEWPATFFIVLTLLAWRRYASKPSWLKGMLIACGCVGSYLTKQTAVFVMGVLLADALVHRQHRVMARRSFWVPMIIALFVLMGYAFATAGINKLAPQLILGSPPLRHLVQLETWTWYVMRLPHIVGWPVIIASVIAVVMLMADHTCRRNLVLPLLWLAAWWLVCTLFAAKEERYFFYATPAIGMIVASGLAQVGGKRFATIGSAALVMICCIQMVAAIMTPTHRLASMRPTVDYLAQQADADLVLVDAVRDGQFVFDVRTTPAARNKIIAMRASKFLYSRSARTRYDYEAHITTPRELRRWLDAYGIRYVVIEDRLPETPDQSWDTVPRVMLRATLTDTKLFERVFDQSLAGDDHTWHDVRLVTYRYLDTKPRQTNTITVRVPAMGRDFQLTLPPTPSSE